MNIATVREQANPSDDSRVALHRIPEIRDQRCNSFSSSSRQMSETLLQKKRFLLFVKILFMSLEQSADSETREKAMDIISDCTRRNRLGDPAFSPLMDAVDQRLRGNVGESHWRRAHGYMEHYLRRQQMMMRPISLRPTQQAEV